MSYPKFVECPLCRQRKAVVAGHIEIHDVVTMQVSVGDREYVHIEHRCPASDAKVSEWKMVGVR